MLIGYARVSTLDQDPTLQLDALKAAGCERIFSEHVSSAKASRPELIRALEWLRAGDVLVVWRLDRLARSLKQLIETVEDLQTRSVELRSLSEQIDTMNAGGRLVFHLFGAMAEFERSLIQERTRAGLSAARARGRMGGRKPKMTEADIKAARALFLGDASLTIRDVATRLGVSPRTLQRAFVGGVPRAIQ
ncbi:recombinase family protein [Rhodospirillum sp. A1_3_36]|uniref:recombinase family protein n=1 Tax=Rhodospirillum sp. A1_3_36 TaxID=3391666 RepID=UPI0039A69226